MLSIYTEYNKKPVTYTYTTGQTFPNVQGKLIRLEISGKELLRLSQVKEIPLHTIENCQLVWYGRSAGGVLKILKEIYLC